MQIVAALIHEFVPSGPPNFDDEGDLMLGFYYQWLDEKDNPVSGLIGPYSYREAVERAADKAFRRKDF